MLTTYIKDICPCLYIENTTDLNINIRQLNTKSIEYNKNTI